mmetsp:Transcript_10801/g.14451  ORF Transcript_10801/g.14451 Transcript_10801/m.14451 type:complete len:92 (+) Transcript_10801:195-470(+)
MVIWEWFHLVFQLLCSSKGSTPATCETPNSSSSSSSSLSAGPFSLPSCSSLSPSSSHSEPTNQTISNIPISFSLTKPLRIGTLSSSLLGSL